MTSKKSNPFLFASAVMFSPFPLKILHISFFLSFQHFCKACGHYVVFLKSFINVEVLEF